MDNDSFEPQRSSSPSYHNSDNDACRCPPSLFPLRKRGDNTAETFGRKRSLGEHTTLFPEELVPVQEDRPWIQIGIGISFKHNRCKALLPIPGDNGMDHSIKASRSLPSLAGLMFSY
ncbi:hypothetical protein AAY473_001567 [Plecturocebus cupreus]